MFLCVREFYLKPNTGQPLQFCSIAIIKHMNFFHEYIT